MSVNAIPNSNRRSYGFVLDAVDAWVQILNGQGVLCEVVLNLSDLQYTSLLECPSSQLLGELAVGSFGVLPAWCFDSGGEPLVLETLHRAEQCEAGRISGLHSRH